jgi:hypothetical protein
MMETPTATPPKGEGAVTRVKAEKLAPGSVVSGSPSDGEGGEEPPGTAEEAGGEDDAIGRIGRWEGDLRPDAPMLWMDRVSVEGERKRQTPIRVMLHDCTIGKTVSLRVLPGEGRTFILYAYRYVGMRPWNARIAILVPTQDGLLPFAAVPNPAPGSTLDTTARRLLDACPAATLSDKVADDWWRADDPRGRALRKWAPHRTLHMLVVPAHPVSEGVSALVAAFYLRNGTPAPGLRWSTHVRHDFRSLPPQFPAGDDVQAMLQVVAPAFNNI